ADGSSEPSTFTLPTSTFSSGLGGCGFSSSRTSSFGLITGGVNFTVGLTGGGAGGGGGGGGSFGFKGGGGAITISLTFTGANSSVSDSKSIIVAANAKTTANIPMIPAMSIRLGYFLRSS